MCVRNVDRCYAVDVACPVCDSAIEFGNVAHLESPAECLCVVPEGACNACTEASDECDTVWSGTGVTSVAG